MTDEIMQMQPPENGTTTKGNRVVLDVKIDSDRIKKYVTLDEYIAFEEGSSKSAKALVASSLWDATNHVFIPYDDALVLVGKMSLEKAGQLFERLKSDLSEEAVPKEYEIASE